MKKITILFFLVFLLSGVPAQAYDYDYFGNMEYHNDVLRFDFSVSTSGERIFFSSSWDDGGFDPMLGLWDAAGNLIYFQDDGGLVGSQLSNGVSYDYEEWDSFYTVLLDPGSYFLTLTTYDNFNISDSYSDGFYRAGETPILISEWSQPSNGFRTDDYAFHILNVDTASGPGETPPVPEPSTVVLLIAGLAGCLVFGRKRFLK
ncbi:DVUA0089 family protein [Pseudodesulfovibrio thermohalotolerans]|uniref:DVUA0089 family protein n=1 Tax=Pseudodesulfovibrio thermohalotolerans TaxID=2880651 RepID=UPI0024418CAD|nr:DVUA0089 family protein [Pseudodesulfovibrio thermohalotolerans]WFS64212.1 DVUA0089 family protein [Pseudodesulfovibrio thermohalotolerans]